MLLELCTKELHFSFNGKIYKQIDGVVMGNPLGPVLANIFMVELETKEVPKMSNILLNWYRYVDDTIVFVKEGKIKKVIDELNKFHKDIKFTYEVEENNEISFLDVLLQRQENNKINLKVYRKKTCSNIYIHWKSFTPVDWKIGTLEGILRRAYIICTTEEDLNAELAFVSKVFRTINGYPERIINQCKEKVRAKFSRMSPTEQIEAMPQASSTDISTEDEEKSKQPFLVVPYAGKAGEKVMKKVVSHLPEKLRPRVVYTGTKLGTFFRLKDKVEDCYCSNLVYHFESTREEESYTGETKCRLGKRIKQHQLTDKKSAIFINQTKKGLPPAQTTEFTILARNYSNRLKRRIAESLYAKEKKSTLNIQKDCYKLTLFN